MAEGHPRDIQETPESMTVEGRLYFNHRQPPALLITLQESNLAMKNHPIIIDVPFKILHKWDVQLPGLIARRSFCGKIGSQLSEFPPGMASSPWSFPCSPWLTTCAQLPALLCTWRIPRTGAGCCASQLTLASCRSEESGGYNAVPCSDKLVGLE